MRGFSITGIYDLPLGTDGFNHPDREPNTNRMIRMAFSRSRSCAGRQLAPFIRAQQHNCLIRLDDHATQ